MILSAQSLLSEEDVQRLKDLNVAVFYIAGTELAIEIAGTDADRDALFALADAILSGSLD
jgi:hypothetical protein